MDMQLSTKLYIFFHFGAPGCSPGEPMEAQPEYDDDKTAAIPMVGTDEEDESAPPTRPDSEPNASKPVAAGIDQIPLRPVCGNPVS